MPAFPDYSHRLEEDPKIEPDDNTLVDYAEDGTPRARIMFADTRYDVELTYSPITEADHDVIFSFYAANKLADDVSFSVSGKTYEGLFIRPPRTKRLSNGIVSVTVYANCKII